MRARMGARAMYMQGHEGQKESQLVHMHMCMCM